MKTIHASREMSEEHFSSSLSNFVNGLHLNGKFRIEKVDMQVIIVEMFVR